MRNNGNFDVKYSRIRALITVLVLILMTVMSVFSRDGADRPEENKSGESDAAYGEYMDWQEVKEIFPKYGNAVVVDLDTGLRFGVQRRGGAYHADVQPLTAGDTEIMKQVYGGKWSWKRRAVLVLAGGRQIAGSMNGMPHGGGQIRGNNFPGHFCIHFRGTKLHINGREDLAHRIMVCKAAGRLEEMMLKSTPEEAVKIFFTALDQEELGLSVRAAYFDDPAELLDFLKKARDIGRVTVHRAAPEGTGLVGVSIGLVFKNSKSSYSKKGNINTVYHPNAGWRVDYSSAAPLMAAGGEVGAGSFRIDEGEDIEVN